VAPAGTSADGSDSSPEVIVWLRVVAQPVERQPLPAAAVKTAEVRGSTMSLVAELVARWVARCLVMAGTDLVDGHRSTFSIPSRAVSDE